MNRVQSYCCSFINTHEQRNTKVKTNQRRISQLSDFVKKKCESFLDKVKGSQELKFKRNERVKKEKKWKHERVNKYIFELELFKQLINDFCLKL